MVDSIELDGRFGDELRDFWRRTIVPANAAPIPPRHIDSGWIQNESGLPWLPLQLNLPYQTMAAEALSVMDQFVEHRGGDGRGWKSLCLHGIDSTKTRSPRHYGHTEYSAPYRWTEVASRCPVTTKYFQECFPMNKLFRVRFMLLESGGFISPHRDTDTRFLSAVNIALTNPNGAYFKMDGVGCVPYQPGSAFLLDVGTLHSCVNMSLAPRIHIIVHGETDCDNWNALVVQSYLSRCS